MGGKVEGRRRERVRRGGEGREGEGKWYPTFLGDSYTPDPPQCWLGST